MLIEGKPYKISEDKLRNLTKQVQDLNEVYGGNGIFYTSYIHVDEDGSEWALIYKHFPTYEKTLKQKIDPVTGVNVIKDEILLKYNDGK